MKNEGAPGKGRAVRAAIVLLAGIVGLCLGGCQFPADADAWHTVVYVNDGDTVVLAGGEKQPVRYLGIDTPEIDHRRHTAEPFGTEARRYNQGLVLNKKIRLEFDQERTDRYGRWLAYVFLMDGTFVNQAMIAEGYGYCYPKKPNTRYEKLLLDSQRAAMQAGKGMWQSGLKIDGECVGNRRSRLFHLSGCTEAKKISLKNRVRFESRWEAYWAGYAPARGCIK